MESASRGDAGVAMLSGVVVTQSGGQGQASETMDEKSDEKQQAERGATRAGTGAERSERERCKALYDEGTGSARRRSVSGGGERSSPNRLKLNGPQTERHYTGATRSTGRKRKRGDHDIAANEQSG